MVFHIANEAVEKVPASVKDFKSALLRKKQRIFLALSKPVTFARNPNL